MASTVPDEDVDIFGAVILLLSLDGLQDERLNHLKSFS